MANTPNLNLELFSGSESPSEIKFNSNNQKIDAVLVKASSHNHDGANSEKINASNVVFNAGETSVAATNMQDAITEVFTEADSKISEVGTIIGTGANQHNEERAIKVIANAEEGRHIYVDLLDSYRNVEIAGVVPTTESSIDIIADAINNTGIIGVTATGKDIMAGKTTTNKYGEVVYGEIYQHPEDLVVINPSASSNLTVEAGRYKELKINTAIWGHRKFIRLGKKITGIKGILEEDGSNGWNDGEEILKTKLTKMHEDKIISAPHLGTIIREPVIDEEILPDVEVKLTEEELKELEERNGVDDYIQGSKSKVLSFNNNIAFQDNNNNMHYVNSLSCEVSQASIRYGVYNSQMQALATKTFDLEVDAYLNKCLSFNAYTNSSAFAVGYIDSNTVGRSFNYAIACVPHGTGALSSRVFVHDLTNARVIYDRILPFVAVEVVVPHENYMSNRVKPLVIGRDSYGNSSYLELDIYDYMNECKAVLTNAIDFKTTTDNSVEFECSKAYTDLYPDTKVAGIESNWQFGSLEVGTDDKVKFNAGSFVNPAKKRAIKIRFMCDRTYGIAIIKDDFGKELARQSTSLNQAYIDVQVELDKNINLIIEAQRNKLVILSITEDPDDIAVATNLLTKNYNKKVRYLTHLKFDESIEETILLFANTDYNFSRAECNSILIVNHSYNFAKSSSFVLREDKRININDLNLTLIDNQEFNLNNSRYRFFTTSLINSNYIFSSFGKVKNYVIGENGEQYPANTRKLTRINFIKNINGFSSISLSPAKQHTNYKVFRPFYIAENLSIFGIEEECTSHKYTYLATLDSELRTDKTDFYWGETAKRTYQEDLLIPYDSQREVENKSIVLRDICFIKNIDNAYNKHTDYQMMFVQAVKKKGLSLETSSYIKACYTLGDDYNPEEIISNVKMSLFKGIYKINDVKHLE